ncbi:MAG TPA: zinc-binding dehydrogenase [Candidatus Corynebacterium avicola]|uniref:Zinc-binding dehydrogenase n=1 Tax=Candidatus Corynebacterium avicola TaxID=2838527 RepID=A0A9D1RRR9_9CORY|nr:zinc-binding dehydrogenase [Candidatus Corynebacterium avicola]
MRAAVATSQNYDDPFEGLELKEVDTPEAPEGWTRIRLRAASLNPHDIWTLRGVGHPKERIPIILGCEGAGVTDDGREVVIYPVMGDANRGGGDSTMDPKRSLMSETINGTLADYVIVPDEMVVEKPSSISFAAAACLGVAWGTAYRMLFTRAEVTPGSRVLVQGGNGGVASAAIALAKQAGAVVYATARTPEKREFAAQCGADVVLEPGERVPNRVDAVIETIGEATWKHSLRALRPGGKIVIAGATSGGMPPSELERIFYQQLSVIGSTGCTRDEFGALLRAIDSGGARPNVETIGFDDIPDGYRRMLDTGTLGKIVVEFP